MSEELTFSVIIPTYKDWRRLQLCLDALANQSFPSEQFEVLVVNNEPPGIVPDGINVAPNVKILYQPAPGSYSARNMAVKMAEGRILAFTDSDCIPHKDWLSRAHHHFMHSHVQRIGGKIQVFPEDENRKTAAELYECVFAFNQKRAVCRMGVSVTANFFVRRECFLKVGLFDASKMSGEDYGWNRRASRLNIKIEYADQVIVRHPARKTLAELIKKKRRVIKAAKPYKNPVKLLGYIASYGVVRQFVRPSATVLRMKSLSGKEKIKIISVTFSLYVINSIEYVKLMIHSRKAKGGRNKKR